MDFIPSPTPLPVSDGTVGSGWTLPFLIILGLALVVTAVVFLWSQRTRT
jgi:hypothetical protein